jgi:hypothetical protein
MLHSKKGIFYMPLPARLCTSNNDTYAAGIRMDSLTQTKLKTIKGCHAKEIPDMHFVGTISMASLQSTLMSIS